MNTTTVNKDGHVSFYGLALGYVDVTEVNGAQVRLTGTGASTYDVDIWGPGPGPTRTRINGIMTGWRQYDTLTEARKAVREFATRISHGEPLWKMLP